jgi:hypothetical protein
LPPETQLLRALPLAVFVVLGLRVAHEQHAARRGARVRQLVIYTLAVHALVGATQSDAWPFSPFRQMAVDSRRHVESRMIAFRCVDSRGREWRVDPWAWSPLFPPPVMGWAGAGLSAAAPALRDEALAFLLQRAEAARQARLRNDRFGQGRLLGRLSAPDVFLHWSPEPSDAPFTALRVYELRWKPRELAADGSRYSRRLVAEYARP